MAKRTRSRKQQRASQAAQASHTTDTSAEQHDKVTDHEFVVNYLESTSYDELAERLAGKPTTVANRAHRLRKAGVNLPKYARKTKTIDVAGLNELVESHQAE